MDDDSWTSFVFELVRGGAKQVHLGRSAIESLFHEDHTRWSTDTLRFDGRSVNEPIAYVVGVPILWDGTE